MRRLNLSNLSLHVGLIAICCPTVVDGQIFARGAHHAEVMENTSCNLSKCPPKKLTYGYYDEHWRRWPEDASPLRGVTLSPFVRPDRQVPKIDVPAPRDEDSLVPRLRGGKSPGSDLRSGGQPSPPTVAPPSTPRPALTEPPGEGSDDDIFGNLPSDLPEEPEGAGDTTPDAPLDGGGFFPQLDPATPDDLPDAAPYDVPATAPGDSSSSAPDDIFESDLPPADFGDDVPSDDFDAEPAENEADDIFNLDDFSDVDRSRQQRYRPRTTRRMRRPGSQQPQNMRRAEPQGYGDVELAAYRQPRQGRRNPLRVASATVQHAPHVVAESPREWPTQPIAADPISADRPAARPAAARPLEWGQPMPPPRRATGRQNPLR